MTGRRIAYLAAIVTIAASGYYFFVYLTRWEWNRALTSGVILLAAEIGLVGALVLERIGRLRSEPHAGRDRPARAAAAGAGAHPRVGAARHGTTSRGCGRRARTCSCPCCSARASSCRGSHGSSSASRVQRPARAWSAGSRSQLESIAPPAEGLIARTATRCRCSHPVEDARREDASSSSACCIVIGAFVVDALGDATQTRDDDRRSRRADRGRLPRRGQALPPVARHRRAQALFGKLQRRPSPATSSSRGVEPIGGGDYRFAMTPSLGDHGKERLLGCMNDLSIDRLKSNVESVDTLRFGGLRKSASDPMEVSIVAEASEVRARSSTASCRRCWSRSPYARDLVVCSVPAAFRRNVELVVVRARGERGEARFGSGRPAGRHRRRPVRIAVRDAGSTVCGEVERRRSGCRSSIGCVTRPALTVSGRARRSGPKSRRRLSRHDQQRRPSIVDERGGPSPSIVTTASPTIVPTWCCCCPGCCCLVVFAGGELGAFPVLGRRGARGGRVAGHRRGDAGVRGRDARVDGRDRRSGRSIARGEYRRSAFDRFPPVAGAGVRRLVVAGGGWRGVVAGSATPRSGGRDGGNLFGIGEAPVLPALDAPGRAAARPWRPRRCRSTPRASEFARASTTRRSSPNSRVSRLAGRPSIWQTAVPG